MRRPAFVVWDQQRHKSACTAHPGSLISAVVIHRVDSRLRECDNYAFFCNIGPKFQVTCIAISALCRDFAHFR